jgi:hydrogenase/urease accessory protein HupE
MILGMSTEAFTLFHVLISLSAIAAGAVVTIGMWRAQRLPGWTAVFLVTTIATSVTGFCFHSKSVGAPHVVGVISLIILAIALIALCGYRLAGTELLVLAGFIALGVVAARRFQPRAPAPG